MTGAAEAVWLPILVALATGLGTAGLLLLGPLHSTAGAPVRDDARTDLEAQLARLIDALRDVSDRAHERDAQEVARETADLEAQASDTLAQLEALGAPRLGNALRPAAPRMVSGLRSQLTGAMWGAGITSLLAFLLWTAFGDSSPVRGQAAQAEPPMATSGGPPVAGALPREELAALKKRLESNPEDLAALLALAHHLLRAQMLEEAEVVNDRALKLAPMDHEALTHAAVLAAGRGDAKGAQAGLNMILSKNPTFAEAWFFRGMLSMQTGDTQQMRHSLTQFLRYAPDGPQKERVRAMLGQTSSERNNSSQQ